MKKLVFALGIAAMVLSGTVCADSMSVGVVNFKKCVEESKLGKQEQNSLEALQNQISTALEKTQAELESLAKKLNDEDYMDGLSPEAEEKLKIQFQSLSQEMGAYQNQYYQMMQQAEFKMMQTVQGKVQEASNKVAQALKLELILNEQVSFFFSSGLDVTEKILAEMDKTFDKEQVSS